MKRLLRQGQLLQAEKLCGWAQMDHHCDSPDSRHLKLDRELQSIFNHVDIQAELWRGLAGLFPDPRNAVGHLGETLMMKAHIFPSRQTLLTERSASEVSPHHTLGHATANCVDGGRRGERQV